MNDREIVTKALEEAVPFLESKDYGGIAHAVHDALELMENCNQCPYGSLDKRHSDGYCIRKIMEDALELLKEQEPVKPSRGNDDNYYCGACGAKITNAIKIYDGERYVTSHPDHLKPVNKWLYCKCCGKAVKWDD